METEPEKPATSKNPWQKLPTWAKWTIGIVGALILLGIGGAIGSSNEDDLKSEVSTLEGELTSAQRERDLADEKASRIEGLKGKLVAEAKGQAATILNGAKRESKEAAESLGSLKSEIASAESELSDVEESLSGAEQTQALSHFGEGIVKAEVDFVPGTYEASGGEGCYWALLNSANTNDMAGNEFTTSAAQQIVSITTPYFQSSDCGTWERIGE
jgi:hypothetical protein